MWLGFFYLNHTIFQGDGLAILSFVTGLPFMVLSIVLIFKLLE